MGFEHLRRCVSALAIMAASATAAHAQDAAPEAEDTSGGEIIVTAQKRAQSAQDVPISIVTLSGEGLAEANVLTVLDLGQVAPNFQSVRSSNTGSTRLGIRGVGSLANTLIEPSVAVFLDGVYAPRSGSILGAFLDIESVEVLRGPQGTLFGRNASVSQKNGITRRWGRRGTRPSAPKDQRTTSAYIYGAICPAEGKGAALILPRCNTQGMTLHLAEISAAVAPGAHAVLLLDQAGWHGANALVIADNITLLPLPPKCPELNPVENVWQFMVDNWLSNRVFHSYDNIIDHCCEAWNKLIDQPWRIMSIGLRQWTRGS